ncbi:MAG: hypothetical protein JOZ64_15830 [Solirubrobacterales bacterium]|nr:hypothetical protein [Solirubrobacterales bacterium]
MSSTRPDNLRRVRLWLAMIGAVVIAGSLVTAVQLEDGGDPPPPVDSHVVIEPKAVSAALPPGFLGLSIEYPAVLPYAGPNPAALNPVFVQLVANLAPNQPRVLRIGGDSSDATWWPVRRRKRPSGVVYSLSPNWLETTRALARRLNARLILGVDLEAGQPPLAVAEAHALLAGIGRARILALELGNEGNRYSLFAWYHTSSGRPVYARRRGYDLQAFTQDFARVRRRLPGVALAGPTVGGFAWLSPLRGFLAGEPSVRVVTFHRYALNRCDGNRASPRYASVANLLLAGSSRGLAQGVAPYAAIAHRHRALFRVDEFNSVACAGKLGVSNTFAAALWSLDALFSLARAGVDGINVHTFPTAAYQLFTFRRTGHHWTASIRPEYYGLVLFAQAAPAGSRLLAVQQTGSPAVRTWATRGRDGTRRLLLINADPRAEHVVAVRDGTAPTGAVATLERLTGPSADAASGATLGGRQFAPATGRLTGRPVLTPAIALRGTYQVTLPRASAALLTFRPSGT